MVLVSGTIGIVAVATMLGLMWAYCIGKIKPNQETHQLHNLWGYIILKNWTTRFVTTCTAVLRVCVNTQLLFMSLILASLSLEYQQVQNDDTGIMTIYQYANSGPFNIALPLLSGLRIGRSPLVLATVMLLALESVVIQFASTILLSDMKLVVLPAENEVTRLVPYAFSSDTNKLDEENQIFKARAREFPVFAESILHNRVVINGNKTGGGLVGSGSLLRALFPLQKSERTNLVAYQGPARVINTRYTCFAPMFVSSEILPQDGSIHNSIIFDGDLSDASPGSYHRHMMEASFPDSSMPDFVSFDSIANCTLAMNTMSFCQVLLLAQDTPYLQDFPAKSMLDWGAEWVLVSIPYWRGYNTTIGIEGRKNVTKQHFNSSEWTTQTYPTGNELSKNFQISHSLCSLTYKWATGEITVKSNSNYSEPRLILDKTNPLDYSLISTTEIQKQLGVDIPQRKSNEDRGIMRLLSFSKNDDNPITSVTWSQEILKNLDHYGRPLSLNIGNIYIDYSDMDIPGLGTIPRSLFANTLRDTGQLSLAWEAISMTLFSAHYYSNLDFYDLARNATMSFFQPHLIPQQFTGFYAVSGILALHFVLLDLILLAFFTSRTFEIGIPDPSEVLFVRPQKREFDDGKDRNRDTTSFKARFVGSQGQVVNGMERDWDTVTVFSDKSR
jgi:hypothetical protein